ncbi:MAG: hypothetical protein V3V78_04600 [Candidatus Woesearchaeota archaeon]
MAKKKTTKTAVKGAAVKKPGMKCSMPSCNGGGVYCGGFIGALIYFLSTATGFWIGVLGILKAIIWPIILVFELLKFVGA